MERYLSLTLPRGGKLDFAFAGYWPNITRHIVFDSSNLGVCVGHVIWRTYSNTLVHVKVYRCKIYKRGLQSYFHRATSLLYIERSGRGN